MAQLLAIGGWTAPGSIAGYLRETLPDDYVIVADPIVARTPIPCIVIGRTGLTVVYGGVDDAHDAPAEGEASARVDPRVFRSQAESALRLFLKDEFPALHITIRYMEALRDWAADLPTWRLVAEAGQADELLAEAIQEVDGDTVTLPSETRMTIGVAMRDRQFTASQRATKPFVFRSGGALHAGRPVWTLRDAVAHMDRYPTDGIHHLRNGTLAEWLDEEGAAHLAQLARSVISHPGIDMRIALETFLLGTGLVSRPVLKTWPRELDLGYVVEGTPVSSVLHLTAGKGRGYLHGTLTPSDPWLQVSPTTFKGSHSEVVVSAETSGLRIRPNPVKAQIVLKCSASEEPVAVPVVLRVMALPSTLSRNLFRPLIGMLAAAPVGAAIGWLCSLAGVRLPVATSPEMPILLVALLWALTGLWRGFRQPAAWPIVYALKRWLRRALSWSLILGGMSGLLILSWTHGVGSALGWGSQVALQAALAGAAAGCLPTALYEFAYSRLAVAPNYVMGRHSPKRIAMLSGAIAGALMLTLLAPRLLGPVAQQVRIDAAVDQAETKMNEGLDSIDGIVDKTIDGALLKLYDHPAPADANSGQNGGQSGLSLPKAPFLGQ